MDIDVIFVFVGILISEDGGCDMCVIEVVVCLIGEVFNVKDDFYVVVLCCFVFLGIMFNIMMLIIGEMFGKIVGFDFGICFNLEFLCEGFVVGDFYVFLKIVIGMLDDWIVCIM